MSQAQLKSAEDGLSGIAKKVLSVVPLQERWTTHAIIQELTRCGSRPDWKVVQGCLNSLLHSGLIIERGGAYQRVQIKADPPEKPSATVTDISPSKAVPMPQEKKQPDALSKLGERAAELRSVAATLNAIADRIDSDALEMDAKVVAASAKSQKADRIAELLREITQ